MDFKGKKILMMGIGGIGVSALARYATISGARVSGCDQHQSSMLEELKNAGIKIIPEDIVNPAAYDLIIRSNAVPVTNRIVAEAIAANIRVLRRGDVLAGILSERSSIAVTGSHGKTTITFLLGHLLSSAGLDPTIYGGGIDLGRGTNLISGRGKWFIAEMDESDKTFLKAAPTITLISNIELEHVDTYPTLDLQVETFENYVSKLEPHSMMIVNGDDRILRKICEKKFKGYKCIYCGKDNENDYVLKEDFQDREGIKVTAIHDGKSRIFRSPLFGQHNAQNMLMALACAELIGISGDLIAKGFKSYRGVRRRFEILKKLDGGGELITDYGHHPTEIAAVLKAARTRKPEDQLVAVFEAHRCSRLKTLMNEFVKTFNLADYVVIADIHTAGEKDDCRTLISELSEKIGTRKCVYVESTSMLDFIIENYRSGETVIMFSAGELDYIVRKKLV